MEPNTKIPPTTSLVGPRIRQRRTEIKMTQAQLAKQAGISASYLNLIEWGKRRIAGALLNRISEVLGVSVEALEGAGERRLTQALQDAATSPSITSLGAEVDRLPEFIGRFPGWANALAAAMRLEQQATARAQVLSDRLSNDPYLSENLHKMLTRIASIRSAGEILSDFNDIPASQRNRFLKIINEESGVLSETSESLATYLDNAESQDPILTPVDEIEALFESEDNVFSELESAANALSMSLADPNPVSRRDRARALYQAYLAPIVDRILEQRPEIRTHAGRSRAEKALVEYSIGALLLPMQEFASKAQQLKYDLEALADAFSTDVETVAHRLTALPRSEEVPRFGYFRANAAGTIIEMIGLDLLPVPRYAAACPLWVLFRAQQSPETVTRQRAVFPNGLRFVFVARARHIGVSGFGRPRHYVTDMLAMTESDSLKTVYAPEHTTNVEEIGPGCRLCPRNSCLHRVEDPLSG